MPSAFASAHRRPTRRPLASIVVGAVVIVARVASAGATPAERLPSDATSPSDRDRDGAVAADPGGVAPPPQVTGPTAAPDDEKLTPLERDAAANRAYAAPTALIAPPGSITISARQPLGRGGVEEITGTFAVRNGSLLAETSVGFGWDDDRRGLTLALKVGWRTRERATIAAVFGRWQTDLDTHAPAATYAALIGSLRTRSGRTLISGHLGMIDVRGHVDMDPWVGASVVTGGPRWKLVVEANAGAEASAAVAGLYVGARFVHGPLAIDAGLASLGRAQFSGITARPASGAIPAWPVVAAAFRFR